MVVFRDEIAPRATVIVVGLREAPMLVDCLDSIAQNVTDVAYEVIVVLNDPTPDLAAAIEQGVRGATVQTFRSNLGFGGAVNFAAERARGEYIVLVNDDCVVTPDWLESLIEIEQRRPLCAIVGSTQFHPDGTLQEAGAVIWSDGTTSTIGDGDEAGYMRFERRVDYSSGGSLLIRKDVWDQLGGFDRSYYPAYFEDVDFCLRAAQAGWEVWYQPLSAVRHARSASTEAEFRRFLWGRAHATFVSRWSGLLETRETNGEVEHAVWKAMGGPIRVLVIGEQIEDFDSVLTALESEPDIHVTFYPGARDDLLRTSFLHRSVRVIDDLEGHVATDGVDYEVVVLADPRDAYRYRGLLARDLARARVIYTDAENDFDLSVPTAAGFEHRAHVGMVAGWGRTSAADDDALLWLAREVMPKVRAAVPGCRLLIAGSAPPAGAGWLDGDAVHVVEDVDDLADFYNRIRVVVSATHAGAGMQSKVLEAVRRGVPVVCTHDAAAGISAPSRSAVWVASDSAGFADAVAALLSNRHTWERQRQLSLAQPDSSSLRRAGVSLWPDIIRSACPSTKLEVAR